MTNPEYQDVHIETTLPKPWEEEETFNDVLYDWMSRAPWLLISAALHFGRPIRRAAPDFWFSFGIAYAYGGRTTVDGIENNDLQQNWRTGGTIAYPFGKGNVLRLSISTSLKTSIGEDSTSGILAYAKAWG